MSQKLEAEKLINFLRNKWGNELCPMCKIGKWNISDTIFEIREFNEGNLVLGNGPIIPIVPITCENCGNTILINALKSGLIEPKTK